MVTIGCEHLSRCRRELPAQQIGEGHRTPSGLDHRDRLGGGELPGEPPGEPTQRLCQRFDCSEIGAGTDDDRTPRLAQSPDALIKVAYRIRGAYAVGHVVGTDHDHGQVGPEKEGARALVVEVS
jgi:hypothetical protein